MAPYKIKTNGFLIKIVGSAESWVRKVFLNKSSIYEIRGFIFISIAIIIFMYAFTSIALSMAEKHARKTGNMALF
jgi:ABC-2 type transport system permease protein